MTTQHKPVNRAPVALERRVIPLGELPEQLLVIA
jgi:hypothetical protein